MKSNFPSPMLIIGDYSLSRENISMVKKKYPQIKWVEFSMESDSMEKIRMMSGSYEMCVDEKIAIIYDIPNKKEAREFLISLVSNPPEDVGFILWDSCGHIKVDDKGKYLKTWEDFVDKIKEIPNHRIVNKGFDFDDNYKGLQQAIVYVQSEFSRHKKNINDSNAKLFLDLVGTKRSLIYSEIQKLSLLPDTNITEKLLFDACFVTSESSLYKLQISLNNGDFNQSVNIVSELIGQGFPHIVVADSLMKKMRWSLAIVDLWSKGVSWSDMDSEIMNMGKFPSAIWHDGKLTAPQKQKMASEIVCVEHVKTYMKNELGLPSDFYAPQPNVAKKGSKGYITGETQNTPFVVQKMISFVRNHILAKYEKQIQDKTKLRALVLKRVTRNYLLVSDAMKNMRYVEDSKNTVSIENYLDEMIRAIIDLV